MAAVGFEGHHDIVGATHGTHNAWGNIDKRGQIDSGLGDEFAISGANFKFVNAGYPIHSPIEVVMRLRNEGGFKIEQIKQIRIGMPTNALRVVQGRAMPEICVEDMVAAAAVLNGMPMLASPFPDVLTHPQFDRIRSLTVAGADAELDRDSPDGRGARVEILLTDGRALDCRLDHPRGHSARGGASWDELFEKWDGVVDRYDCERSIQLFKKLDRIEDIATLTGQFRSSDR